MPCRLLGVRVGVRKENLIMSRRGENVFKRKDGLWEARYVKELDEFGKKKYGSVYAHSYREAKEKRIDIVSRISLLPQSSSKRNTTLSALVEEWLYVNKNRIKPSSYQKYNSLYKKHIVGQIGKFAIVYLNPVAIKQYTDTKLKEGLSSSTVNSILVFIHTCLKYGNKQYNLPITEIVYIKMPKKEMRVLAVEEQRKLTNYLITDTDIYKLGVLVALYTGVRVGELCALKWGDIHDGTITVNKTLQRLQVTGTNSTELVVGEPKSLSSARIIPLPGFICEKVERFRKPDNENFLSRLYHPTIEPRVMQYQFKRQLKICGIDDANFHSLRHTYATRCVEANCDLKTLSELLGHGNTVITANRYIHSSLQQKQICVNRLELIL